MRKLTRMRRMTMENNDKTSKNIALETGICPFLIEDEFIPIHGSMGPDDYKDDGQSIKEIIQGL